MLSGRATELPLLDRDEATLLRLQPPEHRWCFSCKRQRPPVWVPAGVVQVLFREGSGLLTTGRAAWSASTGAATAWATGSRTAGAAAALSTGTGTAGTASTWAWELQGAIFHGFDGGRLFGFVE
jgi:hypothetical protein